MISARLFILFLITLLCREIAIGEAETLPLVAISTLGITLGFGLLVKACALTALSRTIHHSASAETSVIIARISESFTRYRNWAELAWLGCLPLALLATGWLSALNGFEEKGMPQALTLALAFLPSLLFVMLVELTATQLDAYIDDQWPTEDEYVPSWGKLYVTRLRLGDFSSILTCLSPVLLIAAARDVAINLGLEFDDRILTIGASCIGMGVFLIGFPLFLSYWSGARPIADHGLRSRIESYLRSTRVRGVKIRLLGSENRWSGAAILGWFPGARCLWLGDALLERLDERQVDMVLFHELAHVRRYHFLWRLAPVLVIALISTCAWFALDESLELLNEDSTINQLAETSTKALTLIITSVSLLYGLGAAAKRCELDADTTASKLAAKHATWAQNDESLAGHVLVTALTELSQGADPLKATWLHPSLDARIANLSSMGNKDAVLG